MVCAADEYPRPTTMLLDDMIDQPFQAQLQDGAVDQAPSSGPPISLYALRLTFEYGPNMSGSNLAYPTGMRRIWKAKWSLVVGSPLVRPPSLSNIRGFEKIRGTHKSVEVTLPHVAS